MSTMPVHFQKPGAWYRRGLAILAACAALTAVHANEGVTTAADRSGPAQTAYAPAEGGSGPVIVVISGKTGPASYQYYAEALSKIGYYAVLVDGNDILIPPRRGTSGYTGGDNLKKAIERAQHSPDAVPGKVAVIGFSLGGGGALYHAAAMPNEVCMVVAYYPFTRAWANDMNNLVKNFQVPVMVLAGGADHYHDCCVVESMLAMEEAAKAKALPFELVVFPEANHGFNLRTAAQGEPAKAYRHEDALKAWHRTVVMLKQHHPLP
jgi:dienelactone hydrolase